jgi:hypothetical protein
VKKAVLLILCGVFIGCKGPKGDPGPAGASGAAGSTGPAGPAGTTLLKTYSGIIPSDGTWTINVPEITNKKGTTWVECYWAYPSSPSIYTRMSDGWLDDVTSLARRSSVSWDFGQVTLAYMTSGDLYLIHVYGTSTAAPRPSSDFGDRLLW